MNAAGVLLLLLVVLAPFPAVADVFCDNLKTVAAALPKNTSSSPVHFATATFGQAPDVVYALALCRGDVAGDAACGDCVAATFAKIPTPPPPDQCYKAALFYGDACYILYSVDDVLNPSNDTEAAFTYDKWNPANISGDAQFISGLIHELLVQTVQEAAAAEGGGGKSRRFATGVMDIGKALPPVYSLAQCTPDLTAGDCLACLRRVLGMMNSTMALRMGAQIRAIRCYFRYEDYVFYDGEPMVRLRAPPALAPAPAPTSEMKHDRRIRKLWVIPVVVAPLVAAAFLLCILYCRRLRRQRKGQVLRHTQEDLQGGEQLVLGLEGKNSEFSVFDFDQILEATDNFAEENRLGEGGFGSVYKGQFPEGLEIAVKRLASHSGQGFMEFKNEVQLIANLQHRNLVRLLGCCFQGDEKLLVYEYLPNRSLDFFIFDENRRALLDWYKLLVIIEGIAHGLLYLHKHSRLRVIHRDLKPSNILLDSEMNPKISDFGLARIFSSNNIQANTTRRVVGTYGYMAPEYASEGLFSVKSDVFSFGVLVLEILSGKRNSGGDQYGDFINLIGYAWQLWEEGRWIELVDASLLPKRHSEEVMRCINIALLSVQENAADRPTMSDVVAMLSNKTMILAEPKQPAYFNVRVGNEEAPTTTDSCSINYITISVATPR
ncbi:hypothetical protein ACP4OV_003873 [Aristida adscensionis]